MATTKCGAVTFEHHSEFKGEVEITRGEKTISVPIEALRILVAESIRCDKIAILQSMKPASLLKMLA